MAAEISNMEEITTSNAYAGAGGPREEYSSIEMAAEISRTSNLEELREYVFSEIIPLVLKKTTKTKKPRSFLKNLRKTIKKPKTNVKQEP